MDKLAIKIKTPIVPKKWDYKSSVKKVNQIRYKWRFLSDELFTELYIARKKLSKPGARTDLVTKVPRSWTQYCIDIGSSRQVVDRWLFRALIPDAPKALSAPAGSPDRKKAVITNSGDLWFLGRHRLLCGDSRKMEDVKLLLGDLQAAMCFTSPPYNLADEERYPNYADALSPEEYLALLTEFTSWALCACQDVFVNLAIFAPNKIPILEYLYTFRYEYVDKIVWDKINVSRARTMNVLDSQCEDIFIFSTSRKRSFGTKPFAGLSNLVSINSRDKKFSKIIRATFPVALPEYFIKHFSQPKEIIYEPFAGSGSTLIACENTGRICYAIEREARCCDEIIKWWEKETKRRATKCQWHRNGLLYRPSGKVW